MDTRQVALTAKDGHKVFGTHRQPTSPRAAILLVHGITADRHEWGYYDLVGESLQKSGVASLAIDSGVTVHPNFPQKASCYRE